MCLAEGVAVVRRLKKQIEAFKQYRRLGIRTLDQARAFEADRKRREHQVCADDLKCDICLPTACYLFACPVFGCLL